MFKKQIYWLLIFFSVLVQGQNYPITGTVLFTPPSPIYLSNYADASVNNSPIKVRLLMNDLTIQQRRIKLKCYFSGSGIAFQTSDYAVVNNPIYIDGGVSLLLDNKDLAPYFEYNNLQGINPSQYSQVLPEGAYELCIEVYDFFTNKRLSAPISLKKNCGTFVIFQNDPPQLVLPANESTQLQKSIQNVVFSWTPRQINVSNVDYEFELVEVWDRTINPQAIFQYSPPLYTTTTHNTSLQYSISEPQLIPGKRYAWRVKAKALVGFEEVGVFKNNGYSEVFWFDYDASCTAPLAITTTDVAQDQAKVSWTGDISHLEYDIQFREKDANSDWYNLKTTRQRATITNLKPGTTYQYKIGGSCQAGKYTYSPLQEFTTIPEASNANVSCGIPPATADLSNQKPLPQLLKNDVLYAGDYPVVVLNATGGNGTFSGNGYVTFAFLEKFRTLLDAVDKASTTNSKDGKGGLNLGKFTRIKVTFDGIKVNTDFKLIAGQIIASYDKDWGGILDGDAIAKDLLGDSGNVVSITINYEVDHIEQNPNGSWVIVGTEGQVTEIPKSTNDKTFTDTKGNIITAPANGGEPTIQKPAKGGKATAANTNGMSSNGTVTQISSPDVTITFQNAPKSKYEFDAQTSTETGTLKNTYQTLPMAGGKTYTVGYKAISNLNGEDTLLAKATFINGKTKDDITFKTDNGAAVNVTWAGNIATLTLKKNYDFAKESIIAVVNQKPKDSTDKPKASIAGKVNIWHLSQKQINVTLLSVNGAIIPTNAQKELDDIYNKVGVKFTVKTERITIKSLPTTIACGDSNILNTYTTGQQDIINQVSQALQNSYNKNTYYILYTNKESSNGVDGFMPLKRQYGFVFSGSIKTLAHELGHGVFGLQHPFTEYNTTTSSTNLLMDYGTGIALNHNNWEIIHAPGLQLYQFTQGSSAGAQATIGNMEQLVKFANPDKTFTFISISGKPITLPANTTSVTFSTGDDLNLAECADNFEIIPLGTLRSFVIANKEYKICSSCNTSNFSGYYVANGSLCSEAYIDSYTKSTFKNGILGIPCIKNEAVIFKVIQLKNYFSSFNYNEVSSNYTSSGKKISYNLIANSLNNYQLSNVDFVYIPFKFDPVYDDDIIKSISKNISCNCDSTNYTEKANAFIYATQLQKNKATLGCFKTGIPIYFYDENISTNDSFNHTFVSNWSHTNINGFKRLKSDLNKFQNISTVTDNEIYDFLKKYVPESINSSMYDRLLSLMIVPGTPVSHLDIKNQHDDLDCLWESISFSNRKILIEKIVNNNSSFDKTEEILINLIIHEKQNAIGLIDYFKENNYSIFWKIWDVLDSAERNLFVYFLKDNIMSVDKKNLAKTNYQNFYNKCVNALPKCENFNSYDVLPLWRANSFDVADFEFNLEAGGSAYEVDFELETEKTNDNSISIQAKTNFINYGEISTYWKYFTSSNNIYNKNLKPFDVITLVARMDIKIGEKVVLKKDDIISLPAIFIHWIDTSIDTEQNTLAVRLLADALAVAATAYSGGTLTPLLALDATVAGTDIVINVVNETSDKVDPRFKEAWDTIYTLYSLVNLPRAITSTYNTANKLFTFVKQSQTSMRFYKLVVNEEFINDFIREYKVLNSADKSSVLFAVDQFYNQIKNLSLIDLVVKRRLVKAIIELKIKLPYYNSPNSSLLFIESTANTDTFYLNIKGSGSSFSNLANIEYVLSNGTSVPKLASNIRWLPSNISSTTSILRLDDIQYVKNNTTFTGDLEIVKNNNTVGDYFVRLLANNFEAKISSYPNVLSKYNSFNSTNKNKFETDFGTANAIELAKLNENNAELVEVWKNVKFGNASDVSFLRVWKNIIISGKIKHVYYGDIKLIIKSGGIEVFNKEYNATKFLTQELQNDLTTIKNILNNNSALVDNVKHNLKPNQLNAETNVIHLTLSGLHGGHYIDPANATLFAQPGNSVTYLERPNTGGLPYNPDPTIMPPVSTTVTVSENPKGVALNDGSKSVDIIPAAVRVLDKNGWLQIKNTGTLPALTESSKLIWLKKGNNSDGLASIFPKLTAEETEELVAIAFASSSKVWNGQSWESIIPFKGKMVKIKGYGINNGSPEQDSLSTGWIENIN